MIYIRPAPSDFHRQLFYQKLLVQTQLNYYSSLEMHKTGDEVTKNTADSSVLEHKLKALLLDTIHHIDVIEELIEANVTDVWDWNWQKQLR